MVRNLWTGETLDDSGFNSIEPIGISLRGVIGSPFIYHSADSTVVVKEPDGYSIRGDWDGNEFGFRWRLTLKNGSAYARSVVEIYAKGKPLDAERVWLVGGKSKSAAVVGSVPGSPIVAGNIFFGAESPMAVSKVEGGQATSSVIRKQPVRSGQSVTYSAVIGVAPQGQMRRAFLNYLERERPRAYKPFLHYNSWYDLGYFNRYTESECLDRIKAFGEELTVKRGVKLSSFLFDDGWDDPNSVWEFTKAFSNGFVPMKELAANYNAAPGAWLSPWGGYGTPRKERLAAGAKAGMEIDSQGYALSGPHYYDLFRKVTLDMVTREGINQFKFDGTGSPDKQFPGSRFDSDFDAAIALIKDLRAARPGLFVNLTTGTWPSPFWTRYADSIWRGGADHSFAGVGPDRERWITYRDGDTYHGVVLKGPLYPLNSLMLHGLIYAQHADHLSTDPSGAFRHEVRSYFGSGTQLQEMYITPSLLSKQNWDDIAECAKWSQANADVLKDTHWLGGDPLKLEVYGWAAWSPRKAILTLRNPSDKAQQYLLDPPYVFSPQARSWDLRSARGDSERSFRLPLGATKVISLAPFEVLTLETDAKPTSVSIKPIVDVLHAPEMIGSPSATKHERTSRIAYLGFGKTTPSLSDVGSAQVMDFRDYTPSYLDHIRTYNPDVIVVSFGNVGDGSPEGEATMYHVLLQELRLLRTGAPIYVAVPQDRDNSLLIQAIREQFVNTLPIQTSTDIGLRGAVQDLVVDRKADKKGWRLVSADSAQSDEGPAGNAIDGDANTYWHTEYDPVLHKYPHNLVVDMGQEVSVAGFRYLPRQDGGVNGRVKGYEFYVSGASPLGQGAPATGLAPDGTAWRLVAKGDLPNQLEASKVMVRQPAKARYFMFKALSEQNGEPYASAAEIDIIRG